MTALVLLPGMDGTGDLFAPLLSALSPALRTIVIRYPSDRPLGYAELEAHARRARTSLSCCWANRSPAPSPPLRRPACAG